MELQYRPIIEKVLNTVLGQGALPENFPADKPLAEIGLQSLAFVGMIVELERSFQIEVPDSDLLMEKFSTIGQIDEKLAGYLNPDKKASIKKCLVLDCDGVLWDGIAGEEPVSPNIGLQAEAVLLAAQGVLLCLCSSNDRATLDAAFASHPDMPLRPEHVLVWKTDCTNKAAALKEIAAELGLALGSFLLVDDSAYVLGAVEALLSEAATALYTPAFSLSALFDLSGVTPEAAQRARMYQEQRERERAKTSYTSLEEYNASLNTQLTVRPMQPKDFPRVAELSLRTTRFNLSGLLCSEEQLTQWCGASNCFALILSAQDCYGDLGIVGALLANCNHDVATIQAFYLSCRVLDRGFAATLLDEFKRIASERGYSGLEGVFRATDRNLRYADWYTAHGVNPI